MKWQYLTGLRYAEIKQVNKTKQGKQRDNKRMRGDKIPRSGGSGENTPFAKQSRKKGARQGSQQIQFNNALFRKFLSLHFYSTPHPHPHPQICMTFFTFTVGI